MYINHFFCTQSYGFKYFYLMITNQFNINHLISQFNGFKYSKWLNSYFWLIDGTLTGSTPLGQNEPGSNSNEGVFHIPQRSKTRTSPSDAVYCHIQDSRWVGESYPSAEMQSVYSTASTDNAEFLSCFVSF